MSVYTEAGHSRNYKVDILTWVHQTLQDTSLCCRIHTTRRKWHSLDWKNRQLQNAHTHHSSRTAK